MRGLFDGVSSVNRLLRDAARYGAAWPGNTLGGAATIAQICGFLALYRGEEGVRSIVEPGTKPHLTDIGSIYRIVDGIQAAIHRTPGLRMTIENAAEQFNAHALWLRAEALKLFPPKAGDESIGAEAGAREQYTLWWAQLGDMLWLYCRQTVPLAEIRQIPVLIRNLENIMLQSLAVPVVQIPGGNPLAGPAGGPLASFVDQPGAGPGSTGGGTATANAAGDIAKGALEGAALGSVVPGVGTGAGALVGAAAAAATNPDVQRAAGQLFDAAGNLIR